MILGYPWFQKFNPQFDWNTHTLKGNEVEIDMAGYRTKLATSLRAVTLTEADKEEDRKSVQAQIPEAYHKYWEVFSERASYRYPPKREEDHVLRYCRNVRPTWVKFDSKDTKESEFGFGVLSTKSKKRT